MDCIWTKHPIFEFIRFPPFAVLTVFGLSFFFLSAPPHDRSHVTAAAAKNTGRENGGRLGLPCRGRLNRHRDRLTSGGSGRWWGVERGSGSGGQERNTGGRFNEAAVCLWQREQNLLPDSEHFSRLCITGAFWQCLVDLYSPTPHTHSPTTSSPCTPFRTFSIMSEEESDDCTVLSTACLPGCPLHPPLLLSILFLVSLPPPASLLPALPAR